MIVLDTSVLIDGLAGSKQSGPAIRGALAEGERILLPALVLYEWLRGPRLSEELALQESLFPVKSAIPFGAEEAMVSRRPVSGSEARAQSSNRFGHRRLCLGPRSEALDAKPRLTSTTCPASGFTGLLPNSHVNALTK